MWYKCTIYNNGIKIGLLMEQAKNRDEAELKAGFSMACHYPNIQYDLIEGEVMEDV